MPLFFQPAWALGLVLLACPCPCLAYILATALVINFPANCALFHVPFECGKLVRVVVVAPCCMLHIKNATRIVLMRALLRVLRSPSSSSNNEFALMMRHAASLSITYALSLSLSHTLTLSPLCSRKQIKKTKPKKLCKLCAEFFMKTENGTKLPSAPSLPREIRHISLYLVLWAKVNLRS